MSVSGNLSGVGELTEAWQSAEKGPAPAAEPGPCLHELFGAVAAEHPYRPAVTAEDGTLTYRQLDEKSDCVAGELISAGVKPGNVIGLFSERRTELLVGMLGILKSGAAYLPIDPEYPADRIRWAISDAECPVVVVSPGLRHRLDDLPVRTVTTDDRSPAGPPPRAPHHADSDLAYVIHTSGSTGLPKGVQVEHRSAVRLFEATRPWFRFCADDVWTLFHSAAFDFSVWEIWGALLHGGRVVVVPAGTTRSPAAFHRLLREEGVTVLSQTPGAFRRLGAADAGAPALTALRTVVLGGERLDPVSLRPWFERYGDRSPRVINMYGITEATVHSSYRPVLPADLDRAGPSPIGVPLPGTVFHVRDTAGRPVPDGTPGELYIEGPSVARGYLGRPELTAERFTEGAGRTYRTGDRVVRLDDGGYGYLGRTDDQIKLRGFRVEPGEIEALLTRHPAVEAAVVRAHDYGEDDVRLVAYVTAAAVPDGHAPPDFGAELAGFAARSLPRHLRPSAYVPLASLPLTANGKADRAALPAPSVGAYDAEATAADDDESTAARIAAVWRAVLEVERVAPDADFFDLGGTSLSLLRMFERVNAAFGTDMDITVLIDGATIASLASHVETVRKNRGDA